MSEIFKAGSTLRSVGGAADNVSRDFFTRSCKAGCEFLNSPLLCGPLAINYKTALKIQGK